MAYGTQAKMELIFGLPALTQWGDKDRNGTIDTGVVDEMIAEADDYIDRKFLPSRYKVPLEQKSSTAAPTDIVTLSSRYAGYLLWFHFGRSGTGYEYMGKVKDDVDQEIALILATGSLSAKEN